MNKENIVLFETAELAREKGFKEYCFCFYDGDKKLNEPYLENGSSCDTEFRVDLEDLLDDYNHMHKYDKKTSAPTQSLLQKWLWETHGFWVEMTLWGDGMGFVCLIKQAKGEEADGSTIVRQVGIVENGFEKDPYKILEKGIQTALKLIE